jgi:UDP-N-acetylglucosamine/UDP-N-acetylgalactosamine diphosphorylase
MMMEYEQTLALAKKHGQEHIFSFWDELSANQQVVFLKSIQKVDFDLMDRLFEKTKIKEISRDYSNIAPAPIVDAHDQTSQAKQAEDTGVQAFKNGQVGIFLLAGGLGSRLGFDGPKGFYKVTPVKHKTLFEVFAQKILAKQQRIGCSIEWYIMTNPQTHHSIVDFFKEHNFFGLKEEQVVLFPQRVLPAIDTNGKFFLKSKDELFWSPDGAGGFFNALADNGILDRMEQKGIKHLSCFNVDNPLMEFLDPKYIGYHIMHNAQMSNKVVDKAFPEEPVGVLIKNLNDNGRIEVLEYIFLSKEDANKRDENNNLLYTAGNIANYILSVEFIKKVQQKRIVDYKAAFKKFNYIDTTGTTITTQKPNGYKFESFVFDAMYDCDRALTYRVIREEEFAPVKNAEGKDSPQTSHDLQVNLAKKWLQAAGIAQEYIDALKEVEISPLFADTKQLFVKKIQENKEFYLQELNNKTEYYFG